MSQAEHLRAARERAIARLGLERVVELELDGIAFVDHRDLDWYQRVAAEAALTVARAHPNFTRRLAGAVFGDDGPYSKKGAPPPHVDEDARGVDGRDPQPQGPAAAGPRALAPRSPRAHGEGGRAGTAARREGKGDLT